MSHRSLPILISLLVPAAAADKVTFDGQVLPVFQQACLNCHNPDKAKGGLDLSSYSATLKGGSGGKIVEPGDPGSKLIALVEQTTEPKMPPEGDKLAKEQIAVLRQWIEGGLLENENSTARKPTKPKFDAAPRTDPAGRPEGPPPMPQHLLLEPPVVTSAASAIHALAASPWAPLLAVTGQRQVLLHDTASLELVGILPFPEGDPVSLAFTPDGRYLIVGGGVPGKSGVTVTFDITTGARLLVAGKEFDSVLAADIRPSFDRVATGGPSRLLKFWDTTSGEAVKSIKKHTDWITALDTSPDGVLVASGDRNGGVWVWEAESGNEFHTLRAHQAAITAALFRADSNLLATASEDGTVRFWEMNGGTEVRKNDAHPGGVTAFAFARDGSSVTAGRDLKVRSWKPDFNPARELATGLPALPTAVALDGDGKRAFVGDARGTVRAIDTAEGKVLGEIPGNPPRIEARLQAIAAEMTAREKALAEQRQAPETPEKQSAATATEAALQQLAAARKRWAAAAINTRRLASGRLAGERAEALAQLQDAFTAAAAQLPARATVLDQKRAERAAFAGRDDRHGWSPEARAEMDATLAAIDRVIAAELEACRALEDALLAARRPVGGAARDALRFKREENDLREAYFKALE